MIGVEGAKVLAEIGTYDFGQSQHRATSHKEGKSHGCQKKEKC
jgi:hypothetical protein